jgi:hypothetical protein
MRGGTEMTDEVKNQDTVVPLNPRQKPNGEAKNARFSRQARELAILASLPALEYERERAAAAKRLECRTNILDKIIFEIRSRVTNMIPENALRTEWKENSDLIGMHVNWNLNDRDADAFVAFAISDDNGNIHVVVVLADGNGTAWNGTISRK